MKINQDNNINNVFSARNFHENNDMINNFANKNKTLNL